MKENPFFYNRSWRLLEILVTTPRPLWQNEIAERMELKDASVKLLLDKFEDSGIVETFLDRENGRIVKKVRLKMERDKAKEILRGYKDTQKELENVMAALRKPSLADENNKY